MAKTLNNPTGNVVKKSLDLANVKSKKMVRSPKITPMAPGMGKKINAGKTPKKMVGGPKSAPSMIKKMK
jgi:hypothetical protein